MRILAAAILLALPAPARAQSLGVQDTLLGSSVKRLLVGAIRHLQSEGNDDACLVGIASVVNIFHDSQVPGNKPGYYNSYVFYFYSPTKPFSGIEVSEAVDGGPQDSTLGEFNNYSTHVEGRGGGRLPAEFADTADACIADLPVDSGQALAAAWKAGLPKGNGNNYGVHLRRTASPVSRDWGEKSLRRKTYWIVFDGDLEPRTLGLTTGDALSYETYRQYLIDAKTGKFIKKRVDSIRRPDGSQSSP